MKCLLLSMTIASTAYARPKTTVVAVALDKPAADLDAACEAWTGHVEVETDHALACVRPSRDEEPVEKTSTVKKKGIGAAPFYAEGLDMHCGLAITTAAGVFLPPVDGMFGCGSQRSRADWDLRQSSLSFTTIDGVMVVAWVVSEKQTADPRNIGGTGPTQTYRATNVVVCRAGDRPACAVIRRNGTVSLAAALRDTAIRWP